MVVVVVILVDKLRMRETYRSSLGFSYSDTYEDPEWDEREQKNRNVNNLDVDFDFDPPLCTRTASFDSRKGPRRRKISAEHSSLR